MADVSNIDDVALIFEGGGMRAANTSGVVKTLLENNICFKDVFGISAGTTHTLNYISKDIQRATRSFVEFMADKRTAGLGHLLRGQGYFNSEFIYQKSGLPGGILPFDFAAFMQNPAQMHIEALEVDTDKTVHWTKADVANIRDLMNRVQASSSMPVFMPPVQFDGHTYLDGGIGSSWGIQLDTAIAQGYQRFFVVCTQEKSYRKRPPSHRVLSRLALAKYPNVVERNQNRWKYYNQIYDRLADLESDGRAVVYHPEQMSIKNTTVDLNALKTAAKQGYQQAQKELPIWRDFLGL